MISSKELSQILNKENINLKKSLGQHFLVSKSITKKIIKTCNLTSNDVVLEIGAGIGNLTEYLLKKCSKLIAVEKDEKLVKILNNRLKDETLEIVCNDILNLNIRQWSGKKKIKVIGNLPYYISSEIFNHLFEYRECISEIFCSVQKEFAQRLAATPGTKDYGRLALFIKYYAKCRILFEISSESFYPSSKVDSSFVRLSIRDKPPVEVKDEEFFFKVIKASFSSRRKKLVNCLTAWTEISFSKKDLYSLLEKINVNPDARAEDLDIDKFACLSELLIN